jgi:uncharacterized membrane protein
MTRTWWRRALPLLATAILVHVLAVWSAPYLIMKLLMDGSAGPSVESMDTHNGAIFPPPVSAKVRTVVMPSPDLLYSVCVYDLSTGPMRIRANPGLPSYWSIALYGANSDNFYVINDRKAAGQAVDLLLVPDQQGAHDASAAVPGAQVVVSPSRRGFLLMRVLTGDYAAEKDAVEAARRTLVCQKV